MNFLNKLYEWLMVVMCGSTVLFCCYQVFMRYLFNRGISWTEETMRYLYVAIIMLSIGALTKNAGFATITIFSDFVKKKSKVAGKILVGFQYFVQVVFYALLLYYGVRLMAQATEKLTTVSRIPFTYIYAPIVIGSIMGLVNCVMKCIQDFFCTGKINVEKGDTR